MGCACAGEASPADTQPAEAGGKSTNKLQKRMAFDGLTVKLFEDDTRVEEDDEHPIPPRDDCPAPTRCSLTFLPRNSPGN